MNTANQRDIEVAWMSGTRETILFMSNSTVIARVLDGNRLECIVTPPEGESVTISGWAGDVDPVYEQEGLGANPLLVSQAWIYAQLRFESVNAKEPDQQKYAQKNAEEARKTAAWVADLASRISEDAKDEKQGWCSACITRQSHRKSLRSFGQLPVYLCVGCGTPTVTCAGIGCKNMAVRDRGPLKGQSFCAEHRHDIPGFDKADGRLDSLNEYREFLTFEKRNLVKGARMVALAGAGVAMATPLALTAAPAIGGAVGVLVGGYSGAAATSSGLALLGGGSLATGGLGMAGGTYVLTAVGGALGGGLGASVMNAYLRQDKSFHIEMLKGGPGVPVVVCNGFLSESGKGWGEWKEIVTRRYPDSPVYRVHWGARELKNLALFGGAGVAQFAGGAALGGVVRHAARAAVTKTNAIAPALFMADLAKNPWHVAKNRAEKTGVVLADLLARTQEDSYVLIGHSLGARAMVVAAQTLASKKAGPSLREVHLLGAAIGAKADWTALTSKVRGTVYNYHSAHDAVLKTVYPIVELGQAAAGLKGIAPVFEGLKNIDVSGSVDSHHAYHSKVQLCDAVEV